LDPKASKLARNVTTLERPRGESSHDENIDGGEVKGGSCENGEMP
jgi:hypothetical protein